MAQRVLTFLRSNLPDRKPLLWADIAGAVSRRAHYALRARFDGPWLERPQVVRLAQGGPRMEIVPGEVMDRAIYLYRVYELASTRLVRALLAPGMTFVDVGANAGYYSLLAAQMVGPRGRVHAFEPVAATRARLQRNLALNGFGNVEVHSEAVWSAGGNIEFFLSSDSDNPGLSSALPGRAREAKTERVPATTLDDFLAARRDLPVHLVKIDVEGGEAQVFMGARRLLARPDAPAILFESFDIGPNAAALAAYGYAVRGLGYTRRGIRFLEPEEMLRSHFATWEPPNWLALKESPPAAVSFDALAAAAR